MLREFIRNERIAYFSMEIALQNDIPTYSGGLGVLAGDTLRSAADLQMPMVAVTLVSRLGYFHQQIDEEGGQSESADTWAPEKYAHPLPAKVAVVIDGRDVWVSGWLYVLESYLGGRQPVLLLDTDLDENRADDRQITDRLYGGDAAYRLKQEIVLGVGGARLLHALDFHVRQYHLNEGHSALLTLELLRRHAYPADGLRPGDSPYDIPAVRELCNFTTHTPVEAGQDRFPYELVHRLLDDFVDNDTLMLLAGREELNMTRLAMNMSDYVNGVAKRHAEVSRRMFPGYHVRAITNGVHPHSWTSIPFRKLFDAHLPGWCHEPEQLLRADCCIPKKELWQTHMEAKQELVRLVEERCHVSLDVDVPILGFARRMTAYKRPDLLFYDIERLRAIARKQPFQIVLAGKAHPRDEQGKQLIRQLYGYIRQLSDDIRVVFIPGYNMETGLKLVSGSDIWLNTPLKPFEASGTSGMKAAFNGVPNLSVLDGWWVEGCIEGVTGWAIGESCDDGESCDVANGNDAAALYRKLEEVVLPLYRDNRDGWISVMQGAICKNASLFNSHRMMRRYAADAYIR
ncbi:alpha-glucan family phosphorylase [Mariprofundus erugo]|uniref:alpha-glucan family phosphorylase n=1 Tax=Mariprofundus erugo TaxID=2528639 RepID=UPI0010FF5B86|nr:alpha-glucan family phosphorylase [Mariprofundus erugo]TLS77992.1 alpha-glucan family phosphorylase [Mariprofundus erugo]